jgi:protein-L-isoaspartate(D-aspartate) O-methyltransferase
MDFETARFNMVEQQVRTWEVLDQAVLDRLSAIPRERFVPEDYLRLAYADTRIPLGGGDVMMPPREEARLLQALALAPGDHVLEVGTGSGFLAALAAGLARRVTTVEISGERRAQAERNLADYGNVEVIEGDAVRGWEAAAPYDAIAVTGSLPVLDDSFLHQLKPGGRLFVVVGEAPAMEALLLTRTGAGDWATESLFETVLPPLAGAKRPNQFEF